MNWTMDWQSLKHDAPQWMRDGKLAMEGTPREIFSQVERLKELRLDVPQVTLLAYELKRRGVRLPNGILTTEELVEALGL